MNKILFDGDILVYKVGFAVQKTHYDVFDTKGRLKGKFDNKADAVKALKRNYKLQSGVTSQHPSLGYLFLDNMIQSVCESLGTGDYEVWLTGKNNFRDKVAKTLGYKANRKDTDKPVHYDTIREHLITHHKAEVVDGMEADDMLGIRQNNETVIASIDKDLLMIPGHQFNLNDKTIRFVKDPGHLELIRNHGKSPKLIGSGFKWFCAQMLLGDSVDNIQGIKGLGPVRAFNALHPLKTELLCWRMVQKLYVEHDATERLMENANLLWILRTEDQYIKDFLLDLYARSEHGC